LSFRSAVLSREKSALAQPQLISYRLKPIRNDRQNDNVVQAAHHP
jgi:hypothetical protein